MSSCLFVVVVVFPQAPFRVTNVPGQASAGIIQLCNCTLAPLETITGGKQFKGGNYLQKYGIS